jgi:hypothetical protein
LGQPGTGVVHEDAAHDAGGHGEEMRAVLPRDGLRIDQPQIGLVDERRRLDTVSRTLVSHVTPGDLMQFVMNERNQARERLFITAPPSQK